MKEKYKIIPAHKAPLNSHVRFKRKWGEIIFIMQNRHLSQIMFDDHKGSTYLYESDFVGILVK